MNDEIRPYEKLKQAVESTIFYGTGDEAYEEWKIACELCAMYAQYAGIFKNRAEIMLAWIIEDAKQSKQNMEILLEKGWIKEYDAVPGVFGNPFPKYSPDPIKVYRKE